MRRRCFWPPSRRGTYLRLGDYGITLLLTPDGFLKALLIVGVCQVCLYYGDLYELRGIVESHRPRWSG